MKITVKANPAQKRNVLSFMNNTSIGSILSFVLCELLFASDISFVVRGNFSRVRKI